MSDSLTLTLKGPHPIAITVDPASPTLPDNSPAGTLIATVTVTMSDGSQFNGDLSLTSAPASDMLIFSTG